jgi:chemotaxis protein MotB
MDATPIIIKKKKSHGHAHHGGSWKVAYADFVTAMMAFFMVMWIMGLSDDTRTKIQGYFNDPIGFSKNQPRSKPVIQPKTVPLSKPGQSANRKDMPFQDDHKAMKDLKAELEKKLASTPKLKVLLQHIKFQITDDGLRIDFLEDKNDFFESGQAVLKPGAVALISQIGPELAASGRPMGVEGHTDSVPFQGDPLGNFRLSGARANALADGLARSGVPPIKFLYVNGLGDRKLSDPKNPTSTVNRRVTILLPFVTPLVATTRMPKAELTDMMKTGMRPVGLAPSAPDMLGKK